MLTIYCHTQWTEYSLRSRVLSRSSHLSYFVVPSSNVIFRHALRVGQTFLRRWEQMNMHADGEHGGV
jgi:hypothetical protein